MRRLLVSRRLALVLAGAVLLALGIRSGRMLWRPSAEDFVYYYAGTSLYWEGSSPYNYRSYQKRIESLLGGPNTYPSKTPSFLYPPFMAWVFGPFASMDKLPALRLWSLVLAVLVLVIWWRLAAHSGPLGIMLTACFLLACPGADNAFFTHRVLWLTLAAWLLGLMALERRREILGGLCFGLLGIQPQWLLVGAVCLALGRRWKALAAAALLNGLTFAPYVFGLRPWAELTAYLSTLAGVGGGLLFRGNLSLAAGLSRLLEPGTAPIAQVYAASTPLFHGLWLLTALLFLGIMIPTWRGKGDWEARTRWTFALAIWVQPYSHISELLWTVPWILGVLRLRWSSPDRHAAALVGALALSVLLRLALDFPAGRGHIASAYLLMGMAAGAIIWKRKGEGAGPSLAPPGKILQIIALGRQRLI